MAPTGLKLGGRRRGSRALAALALAALVGLALADGARAHAFLVRTTPRPGERLAASPPAVTLQFSEPIVGGERLSLRTVDGRPVPAGALERLPDGAGVRAELPTLDEAIYVASWSVLGRDGDVSAGEFAFAVGTGGQLPTAGGASTAGLAWPNVAASWLFLAGLAVALGGLASEAAVWGPVARRHGVAVPRAPVVLGLVTSLVGAALSFVLIAGARAGGGLGDGLDPRSWAPTLGTRPGLLAAAGVFFVAYALWIVPRRLRAWALVPLTGAVVAAAWRGHSGVSSEAGLWWAAPANALHLAGASLWVGALAQLVVVLRRLRGEDLKPVASAAARRYAGLALPTVLLMLAGGLVTALAELTDPAQLVTSDYGRLLLLKLLFVGLALALALASRRRALPANPGLRLGLLRRLTAAEAVALVAVVGISAALLNAATPRGATAEADLLGPPPLDGPVVRVAALAGQLAVFLAAAEGRFQLQVVAPSDQVVPEAQIRVDRRSQDGAELVLYPRSCGRGCSTMEFDWPVGTSRFTVTAAAPDRPGGTVELAVPWPPSPEDPALLGQVIDAMRAQDEVTVTERVSSGPGATVAPNTFRISGARLMEGELYVASGADDVRTVPSDSDVTNLVLFLPGSWTWYRLGIDAEHRLRDETIVNPGHVIERTFTYEPRASSPAEQEGAASRR